MNTSEVIRNRHSIRKYKKGVQIPRKDIETMLEAAMFAPSAC
ncbi:MAG: nitroreductase family protein, partial [Blautia sp.]